MVLDLAVDKDQAQKLKAEGKERRDKRHLYVICLECYYNITYTVGVIFRI